MGPLPPSFGFIYILVTMDRVWTMFLNGLKLFPSAIKIPKLYKILLRRTCFPNLELHMPSLVIGGLIFAIAHKYGITHKVVTHITHMQVGKWRFQTEKSNGYWRQLLTLITKIGLFD